MEWCKLTRGEKDGRVGAVSSGNSVPPITGGSFQDFGGQEGQQGTSLGCRPMHIMARLRSSVLAALMPELSTGRRSGQIPPVPSLIPDNRTHSDPTSVQRSTNIICKSRCFVSQPPPRRVSDTQAIQGCSLAVGCVCPTPTIVFEPHPTPSLQGLSSRNEAFPSFNRSFGYSHARTQRRRTEDLGSREEQGQPPIVCRSRGCDGDTEFRAPALPAASAWALVGQISMSWPKDWCWAAEAPIAVSSLSSQVGCLQVEGTGGRKNWPVDRRR